jgi:hypothetical protein
MTLKETLAAVLADPRYQKNIEYGEPRPGHPEGSVKAHIAELEANLTALKPRLRSEDDYWKLMFLIHVHDTFKADAALPPVPIRSPHSHASLAVAFARNFTDDADLLNMLQFHDEGYALWLELKHEGHYNSERFQAVLNAIQDWDLFLLFTIIDGCTAGKDKSKTLWFINEVKKHKATRVEASWIL